MPCLARPESGRQGACRTVGDTPYACGRLEKKAQFAAREERTADSLGSPFMFKKNDLLDAYREL